jgi:hypothetical protein|tara:strand:- start:144 stop:572 length:429 start_codon:yes stop_codon:yes gene_type:complete
MIKYKLICKNCDNSFDSWFASSSEFEKLKTRKLLTCHCCNSRKIEKTLMAPKIINNYKSKINNKKNLKITNINKNIKEYRKFIKNNFEYVGENFAYEARSIHYDNKKRDKGIFGSASNDEIKELRDEGIKTEIIPWIEDKSN